MRSAPRPQPNRKTTYTAAEFAQLPEGPPYYELIMNQLTMPPAPDFYHQLASSRLHIALGNYVDKHAIGVLLSAPTDVFFDEKNVFQPDLLVISYNRLSNLLGHDRKIHGAPDLVVEFLSSNKKSDLIKKRRVYEQHGVKEYWIIDPKKQTVEVLSLQNGAFTSITKQQQSGLIKSVLFPEFEIETGKIFAIK